MNVTCVRPGDLTEAQLATWRELLTRLPTRHLPFLHPAYLQILGEYCPRVEVGVLSDNGQPVGFFPFERHRGGVGRPAGMKLSDFQAVIAPPDARWTPRDLLEGCGLRVWHFDHLLADETNLVPFRHSQETSWSIDIAQGYEAYRTERKRSQSNRFAQTERKQRKLERELGPLRFEWHTSDDAVFRQLIEWKRDQRRRSKTFDVLQFDWVMRVLERVRATQVEGFAGQLSALYAGDRLVAANLGMQSGTVLHYWFPAYEPEFGAYSPGAVLLLEMARAAAARGLRQIELGKGDEHYKASFGSAGRVVAEGTVDLNPVRRALRTACVHAGKWLWSTAIRRPLQPAKRLLRQIQYQLTMSVPAGDAETHRDRPKVEVTDDVH